MAVYPGADREVRIPLDLLAHTVSAIFRKAGMHDDGARIVTQSLVEADLRGIHSHGVLRVPDYVKKLTEDGVDGRARPELVIDNGAALVVDCNNNLGQVGMAFAMQKAIERAAEINVAFAAVAGSNHSGTMEFYARMALDKGMIGVCGTNALPTMAPWGGRDKIIGINPLGIAMPGDENGDFVLDIAFGATAHGKIRIYAQKGEAIPDGWAFDADGQPTRDAIKALDGLIQPIGGHKGVGLGMAIGMLSSLLSGAGYGTESGNMIDGAYAGMDGHFVMALNVEAFTDLSAFRKRVGMILKEVRDSGRSTGVDRLFTPGEIEAGFEHDYRKDGIPLNDETLDDIVAAAGEVRADVRAFAGHVQTAHASR